MALTKRVFSIALALLLGVALLMPGAAEEEIDPNAPIITRQPKPYAIMFAGNTLNLEIVASLPAGNGGTLRIDWYDYDWQPGDETAPVASGAKAAIPIEVFNYNLFDFPDSSEMLISYYAVLTNTYIDSEGEIQTVSIKSEPAEIQIVQPLRKIFADLRDISAYYGTAAVVYAFFMELPTFIFGLLPAYFIAYFGSLIFPS